MAAQIAWLEGAGVSPVEVGARAAALAQLRGAGLCVPRGFALGRSILASFVSESGKEGVPARLPVELQNEINAALRSLGGSFAIRRSPLEPRKPDMSWQVITQGGRPERETYLHLTDPIEVTEAARRIWGASKRAVVTPASAPPVAIVVQRFILPEVCAIVRCEQGVPDQLQVLSALGIGDLLAAGLVVPDCHTVRRKDGDIVSSSLGRKAQMTIPRSDGGVVRVPVPAASARRMALEAGQLAELAKVWRAAEEVIGPLYSLAVSWSTGKWHVTTAVSAPLAAEEGLLSAD